MTGNNIVLLALWGLAWQLPGAFFATYLCALSIAGGAGIALFTGQHNFEGSYASDSAHWDVDAGSLRGTSFLVLPGWLNWVTANIGFHHVHLRVKDPTATLNWFEQNIGGERTKLYGKLDGMRYNGVWLFAMASGDTAPAPPTAILLVAFRYNDMDAAFKALTSHGVKLSAEPRDLPILRYGFVEDPNGIRVEIVRRNKQP